MMHIVVMLVGAALFPVAMLGLLLWLGWLEERLGAEVRKDERRSAPEPVRAVPVQQPVPVEQPAKQQAGPAPAASPMAVPAR
ncbi:MAG: hypothetical protein ACXVXB_16310 [Nocardioidaceae bacterium]